MKRPINWVAACVWATCVVATGCLKAQAPEVVAYFHRETPILLGAHEHWVEAIAFSPDGKTLATGCGDGYLRLWDAQTGRLRSMHGVDAMRGVNALDFSPEGRFVATVGAILDNKVKVWDVSTGQIAYSFPEQTWRLNAAKFSPDGHLLATAGENVVVREFPSGKVVATLAHSTKRVSAIAFSGDGRILATAANDRKVRLWNVPSGELEATLEGASHPVNSVAISADGSRVVAASSVGRLLRDRHRSVESRLWVWQRPSDSARQIATVDGRVNSIAFIAPSSVVASAGREILLVDLSAPEKASPRKLWTHSEQVLAVAVSPDGNCVASGGHDRTVDVVDVSTAALAYRLPGLNDHITSVATSSDGKRFATASRDVRFSHWFLADEISFAARHKEYFSGEANASRLQPSEVHIWTTEYGRLESTLPLPPALVTAIAFIPKSDLLAVAGWVPGNGGLVSVWDVAAAREVHGFTGHQSEVLSIAASPDGRTLASGDAAGGVELWDVRSGTKKRSMPHEHRVEAVAFSANGEILATGDSQHMVRLYDVSSGKLAKTLKSRSRPRSLAFSPDGMRLASGTWDPGMEIWNDGLELFDLKAETSSRTLVAPGDHFDPMPGFVAFSPDGRFVVCGGKGKNIAVFEAESGQLHGELMGHYHAPTAAAFLPDGRLVSGGDERTIRLWNPETSELLATWITLPEDERQTWPSEWVGYTRSGKFVGSTPLDRLIGWNFEGKVLGPDEFERVESLFKSSASAPTAKN